MFYALISHINTHVIRGRPTPQDGQRLHNRMVHKFQHLKVLKTLKEITNVHEQNFNIESNNNKQIIMLEGMGMD